MYRCTLFCLILLVACGSSDDPVRPVESLQGFELEFATEVRQHTPVLLTVRAVGDSGSSPFRDFNGEVELAIDTGLVEPASIDLVDGVGTATVTVSGAETAPTLTVRGAERSGTLTFAIGRFLSSGTLRLAEASVSLQGFARIRFPESNSISDQSESYDVVPRSPLAKSVVAERAEENREGRAVARGLAKINSSLDLESTSLSLSWTATASAFSAGVDTDLRSDGGGAILGTLRFEVVGEPLLFELEVNTVRDSDKGATCLAGMSLTNTGAGVQDPQIADFVNGTDAVSGLLVPGTYSLVFDATAATASESPDQVLSNLIFDIRLEVHR